ncbi:MAG: hypothetical protein ACTHYN_05935 [Marinobacter sp.]|uniref:hypothetical protein n=1 Tax=Marinobacter sp. TaxID=50741 RepID=UPI003F9E36F7
MKWIIIIVVVAIFAFWLYRGRRKNRVEDPEVKTIEKKDYYLTPDDNSSDESLPSGDTNSHRED